MFNLIAATHLCELAVLAGVFRDDLQGPGQVGHVVDVAVGVHVAAAPQLAGRSQLRDGSTTQAGTTRE